MPFSFIATTLKSFTPVLAIFIVSLFVSVLITIVYKFTTNQTLMKSLHAEMKSLRAEIKNTKDTGGAGQLNKRLMELTMKQAMHSMRSTFITIIPIFLIFGWMQGNFAFEQATPEEVFTTTMYFAQETSGQAFITASLDLEILSEATQNISDNKASWEVKGPAGDHQITYEFGEETYARDVIITDAWRYADPILEKKRTLFGIINLGDDKPLAEASKINRIAIDLNGIHPFGGFTLFGWRPGWLAVYFLFTVGMTFPIRRLFKVH